MHVRGGEVAGWIALVLVGWLGLCGAAAVPGGILFGLADGMRLLVLLGAILVLMTVSRGRGAAPCVGLALVPALQALGAPIPGLSALTGPPVLALAMAGVAMVFAANRELPSRRFFFPAVLIVYFTVAARVQTQVGPQGDEPHYLMVADSLLRDGDVSLERDYADGRYRAFHPRDLAPHFRVRGRHGEIYSIHALGLSLLILPAFWIAGYPGASFLMAFLAALLALELSGWLRDVAGEAGEGLAWALALSPPLIHYAGLVFTEIPAALIVALVLRRAPTISSVRGSMLVGSALAFLPWLNVRYAPLALLLLLYSAAGVVRRKRSLIGTLVVPLVVSATALAFYHHALYGFLDPRRVYGRRPELAIGNLPDGLVGLLLDQEFGLLMYAPLFVLAVPGLVALRRKMPGLALVSAGLLVVVLLTAGAWPMWRGGWNPPARFLVPLLPVLALGVAWQLSKGLTAGAALLLGWGVWTGLAGGWEPRLVHRDRDGTAPLFRVHSGAEEWTRLLPAYVLSEPDRNRLAVVWTTALVMATLSRKRTAGAVALASLGLLGATATASKLSDGRSSDRDAVRLVGRPAIRIPGWAYLPVASATWDPKTLEWGPVYEPHRHPTGAPLGNRLPLPAGRYVLRIDGDVPGRVPADPPQLEIRTEGPAENSRRCSFSPEPGGWEAAFDVLSGENAVTLVLRGDTPILLKDINLRAGNRSNPMKGA